MPPLNAIAPILLALLLLAVAALRAFAAWRALHGWTPPRLSPEALALRYALQAGLYALLAIACARLAG